MNIDLVSKFKAQMELMFEDYTTKLPSGDRTTSGMLDKLNWLSSTINDINKTVGKLVSEYSNGDSILKEQLHSLAVERTRELIASVNGRIK